MELARTHAWCSCTAVGAPSLRTGCRRLVPALWAGANLASPPGLHWWPPRQRQEKSRPERTRARKHSRRLESPPNRKGRALVIWSLSFNFCRVEMRGLLSRLPVRGFLVSRRPHPPLSHWQGFLVSSDAGPGVSIYGTGHISGALLHRRAG